MRPWHEGGPPDPNLAGAPTTPFPIALSFFKEVPCCIRMAFTAGHGGVFHQPGAGEHPPRAATGAHGAGAAAHVAAKLRERGGHGETAAGATAGGLGDLPARRFCMCAHVAVIWLDLVHRMKHVPKGNRVDEDSSRSFELSF